MCSFASPLFVMHFPWLVHACQLSSLNLMLDIQKLKEIPHDPIDLDIKPHIAYFGGLFDGDV